MPTNSHPLLRRASVLWRRYGSRPTSEQLAVLRRRFATVLGALALGFVALGFASLSDRVQKQFLDVARAWPYLPLLLTPAAFALAVLVTKRWAPETGGSGIPQVIAASRDPQESARGPLVSLKTAATKFVMTIVGLAGGGSFGREGPTVQISAAIMVAVHRALRVPITPGVLIAGGAAGVAAAFNTPLAGVAFAIEELAAAYEQRVAILVMGAVMIAGLVSLGVAGDYVYFGAMRETLGFGPALYISPIVGAVGGLTGGAFSRIVLAFSNQTHDWMRKLHERPIALAAGCGAVVAVVGIASGGETFGTGYETSQRLVEGAQVSLAFAPAKLLATLASTLSGNPGGIFAPSLSVGAGLGNVLAVAFPDNSASAIVVLGMVAHFTGVVRAPFTAVIIVSEATAGRGMILPLFIAALCADAVSALVCRTRLYHGLAKPFLPVAKAAPTPQ
jgi:chloride channel protein, CIC family